MKINSPVLDLPLVVLKPHEEFSPARVEELTAQVRMDGQIHTPILVDGQTFAVLDGHHRVEVAKRLGLSSITARVLDYVEDDEVVVEAWRDGDEVSKQDVLQAALSGRLLPVKTSRHRLLRQAA